MEPVSSTPSAALGLPVHEIASHADTVMFCLSKALGAPAGSMLAGPADLIAKGRLYRKRLGGGMRQAGILAAAGLVALEESPAKLPADHANARFLAEGLARIPGIQVDPAKVDTNIVVFDISATGLAPADVSAQLEPARRPHERHQPALSARGYALRCGPGAVRPGGGSGRLKAWPPPWPPLKRHNGIITWTYDSHAEILDPAVGRHCLRATIHDFHRRRRRSSRYPGIGPEHVDRAAAEARGFRRQHLFQQRQLGLQDRCLRAR